VEQIRQRRAREGFPAALERRQRSRVLDGEGEARFEIWHRINIADNHAAEQWAQGIRRLVQEDYPQATREEHREARERKRRAGCAAPRVGVGLSIWSESGA